MPVQLLNNASPADAGELLRKCCGATGWVEAMVVRRPFASQEDLLSAADQLWWSLKEEDWLEAFRHHPVIGDIDSLRAKFANTRGWASNEQSGCLGADEEILQELARGNAEYKSKFGFIFIVCATGKSAEQMLSLLNERLPNEPVAELRIAAGEQAKITKLRLEKLCQEVPSQPTC
jgi:2-oxo-4-hydroxy-4-carboxy-5-ureidoimidazoline decarboxylase